MNFNLSFIQIVHTEPNFVNINVINRPGEVGAVLQAVSLLINWVSHDLPQESLKCFIPPTRIFLIHNNYEIASFVKSYGNVELNVGIGWIAQGGFLTTQLSCLVLA